MLTKRTLLAIMVVAVVSFFAWSAWNKGHIGWVHILGLAVSVLLLILIWCWPGGANTAPYWRRGARRPGRPWLGERTGWPRLG